MKKILGKEITDVSMAQKYVDGIMIRGIRLVAAFALSFLVTFLMGKAMTEEAVIWTIAYIASVVAVMGLLGLDKVMYLIKLIPAAGKKGWQTGKAFHSFILACGLGYVYMGAVGSFIVASYVMIPAVGVAITFLRSVFGYFTAKRYLAEA